MALAGCLLATAAASQVSETAEERERRARDITPPAAQLGPIEISAPLPAPEQERLRETIPSISVNRQQIEQQPNGLRADDIVKRMPGVYTGGAPGEDKDVRLRGVDKEFTRTTIDGLSIPDSGEKRELNLDRLPASLVEEVKIIRLPSAEYEADGIAGRVDLKTRPIPDKRLLETTIGISGQSKLSGETRSGSVVYGERYSEKFGLLLGASRQEIEVEKTKDKFNAAGVRTEREEEEKPIVYHDLKADFGYFYSDGELHLKPMVLMSEEDKTKLKKKWTAAGVPNGTETEAEAPEKRTLGATLVQQHDFTSSLHWDGEFGYITTTEEKDKLKRVFSAAGVENTANREIDAEDKTDQIWLGKGALSYLHDGAVDGTVKSGVSLRMRDRQKDKFKTKGGAVTTGVKEAYALDEQYSAGFVQDELRFGDTVTVTPGLRLEVVNHTITASSGISRDAQFVDWLPSVPVAWKIRPDLVMRAGVARAVNRPKFDELSPFEDDSTAGKLVRGNPDLEPARAWAYDIGVDYVTSDLFLGINLFRRDIRGVIEAVATGEVVNGRTVEQVKNVGNGYLQGIELEQRFELGKLVHEGLQGFRLSFNETIIDSRLKDNAGISRPFKEQPPYLLNAMLDWRSERSGTSASIAFRYVPSLGAKYSAGSGDSRGAERFIDLRLAQEIVNGWEVFFLGTNITDQGRAKRKTDNSVEVEATGASYLVGLRTSF